MLILQSRSLHCRKLPQPCWLQRATRTEEVKAAVPSKHTAVAVLAAYLRPLASVHGVATANLVSPLQQNPAEQEDEGLTVALLVETRLEDLLLFQMTPRNKLLFQL